MRQHYPLRLKVPQSLIQVPLEELVLPARMIRFAKRSHARFLGHLDGLPEWQLTQYAGRQAFEQLQRWLDKVRLDDWRREDAKIPGSPSPLDELIRIPRRLRSLPIAQPPFSARLVRGLQTYGLTALGDLEGLRFRRIRRLPHIGPKSLNELRDLLRSLATADEPRRFWTRADSRIVGG
jgi:hypothetical protein